MESIIAVAITGVLALLGVIASNSKGRDVAECRIDELARKVGAHNRMIERTYALEQNVAALKNDVVTLYHKTGRQMSGREVGYYGSSDCDVGVGCATMLVMDLGIPLMVVLLVLSLQGE